MEIDTSTLNAAGKARVQSKLDSGAYVQKEGSPNVVMTAPKNSVVAEAPTMVDAKKLPPQTSQVEQVNDVRNVALGRVQDSLKQVGSGAIANEAFIQGVAQAKFGRPATADELAKVGENKFGLMGATVGDVVKRFGLETQMENFGVEKPIEAVPNAPTGQQQDPAATTAQTGGQLEKEAQDIKSASDKVMEAAKGLATVKADAKAEARDEFQLTEKGAEVTRVAKELNDLRTDIQNQGIFDIKEEDIERGKPILRSIIAGNLENLSREQKLDMMISQNNYNNKLVEYQIAQGDYQRAEDLVRETADDAYENQKLMLDYYALEANMEAVEYDRLNEQLGYERDLALAGYTPLNSAEEIAKVGTNQIFTDPLTGKSYKRPEIEAEIIKEQYEDRNGNVVIIGRDRATGEEVWRQELQGVAKGLASSGGGGTSVTNFTAQEKRKLEQAGLDTSTREEQLNFLYGEEELTKIQMEQNFNNDLIDLLDLGYKPKEAWDLLVESGGELTESEIRIFKQVFGNFWGDKPGWG